MLLITVINNNLENDIKQTPSLYCKPAPGLGMKLRGQYDPNY